jgi:ribosomal protein L6P/L9E
MFYNNIKKIVLDYKNYNKFLNFVTEKNFLKIRGFFGEISLKIPKNVIVRIDDFVITLYFNEKVTINKIKYFYNTIIYSCISVLFNHFVNLSVKGIGFKFDLNKDKRELLVFNGNRLPVIFNLPSSIKVLMNTSIVNISILGGDNILLNNFVNNIRKIAIPNKYKEIGIFLEKKL